jgi:hypothetical protein
MLFSFSCSIIRLRTLAETIGRPFMEAFDLQRPALIPDDPAIADSYRHVICFCVFLQSGADFGSFKW